ncbi:MAG: 3-methyl-2-oxobutanoate hydroxymethyltransferase, partial [Rhodospirillales bacterium]|nr:3-methyl-2-oxobutanoate hydroxymethyltransferase [Rhodospirillales bacterium]
MAQDAAPAKAGATQAQSTSASSTPALATDRKKRTITEIRDSKRTGEKMVYTSVLDYTSAKWAEAAGVDVCVVGDSLAMTCHGHPSTVP